MSSFDDRRPAPPTVGHGAAHRVRGRPILSANRFTRRPHGTTVRASALGRDGSKESKTPTLLTEWHTMSRSDAVLAWEELCGWTTWLVSRYRLTVEDRLPACWPQHPELIEELWALRAWRAEAYSSEGTGQSAVYWHQALVTFLSHVSGWWAGGCRAGHVVSGLDVGSDEARAWASADPLAGLPQAMRRAATASSPARQSPTATPPLNVLTASQMQALTNAGLARPHDETVAAFTYYDGSWWAFTSGQEPDSPSSERADDEGEWFRADDIDFVQSELLYKPASE